MRKNEKIVIGILIVITIIVIIFAVNRKGLNKAPVENITGNTQTENRVEQEFVEEIGGGVSVNTSNKIKEVKKFEGLEIKEVQMYKSGNTTQVVGKITNTTEKTIPFQMLKLKIVDKEGKEIITVALAVKELTAGESTQLSTSATFDYVNAYDYIIQK